MKKHLWKGIAIFCGMVTLITLALIVTASASVACGDMAFGRYLRSVLIWSVAGFSSGWMLIDAFGRYPEMLEGEDADDNDRG